MHNDIHVKEIHLCSFREFQLGLRNFSLVILIFINRRAQESFHLPCSNTALFSFIHLEFLFPSVSV